MIFNRRWYEDTYSSRHGSDKSRFFFLGGAAHHEDSPIILIGGVEHADGWILFAQRPCELTYKGTNPQTVNEYLEFAGPADDPVMGVILDLECPGGEQDVVHSVLEGGENFALWHIPPLKLHHAKQALLMWLRRMDD